MLKVSELIEQLKQCPADAMCHVCEGEVVGVAIAGKDGNELIHIVSEKVTK